MIYIRYLMVLCFASIASGRLNLHPRQVEISPRQQRADAVKEAFRFAWNGYHKFAFPNDELLPVSNGFGNSRNSWGASAVDALSTAIVLEMPDIVNQILEFIPTINFDKSDTGVSLFETTIRYLGGLLSAYDLLSGPSSGIATNQTSVDLILKQATRLADNLAFAFNTPSGIPINELYFTNKTTSHETTNSLACAGTLVLEWTRLSDLTGDPKYATLSQKAESYLLNPKPAVSEPWPGLVGGTIDVNTGEFVSSEGGWIAGSDSFYEYLIKMYAYDTSRFASYRDRWVLAADSTIAHLASHPSSRPDLSFLAYFNGTSLIYESEHLACFDGGNFILGGLVLDEPKYIDFGLDLVNGCHETYAQTLTGIGPEIFRWVVDNKNDTTNPQPPANQTAFYDKAGFYIVESTYNLRPEVIESFYYAYRVTRDQKYQDWAWNAFKAINATSRTGSGFAALKDINAPNGGGFLDLQESFFFAEVLKYSYLIHAPESELQVEFDGTNRWVYNTEAHPLRVAGTPT
ncbi:Mannosyl-oligosaccharide alpha-1,2-mannosidase [Erysiphe neolycopersici]|uniref:alpha-1,2-Mannosidase n=1 Tax=Erysiphe neolycopersici TaxID=212602 RepID=A0A420HYM8_9PEZI|nr:Mannosyl-oligosaccharide alpha-1,2-mannosidase [Erysiphe neolycopersici]